MTQVEPICLFCLEESNEEFKHSFDCDCTFQYHQKCLDEWIKVKICVQYVEKLNKQITKK